MDCYCTFVQEVHTLRQHASEAKSAQEAALAAEQAALKEKCKLSEELQSAHEEVASILEASKVIQVQLGDATKAMQILQGRVDTMTLERDGLTSRICQADTDLQKLKDELQDQTALYVRIQVRTHHNNCTALYCHEV